MSLRFSRDSGCVSYRRQTSADGQQQRQQRRHVPEKPRRQSSSVYGFSRDATSLKKPLSACEENFPTVLPVLLDVVRGPNHLPADEASQEMLRGKLCLLQADSTEVNSLLTELSTHLVSISSEDKAIYVTFQTFEEIWKFTTYYMIGFVGHCLENILFDPVVWLSFLEEDITIEVSIQEETLHLIYNGVLMQEGSLFASCTSSQMFDSSTSGGDLYLEQGDIAQFEPPFLGSGWTVLCLADGARGTTPRLALEPVIPFHQWFLKSCPDSILVGDGKPACDFPLQFARGTCLAIVEYVAEGPDELSLVPGDRIIIVGLLVSCFDWFTGRKESTGEIGLVKTTLVKPSAETLDSADIFLDGEEWMFSSQLEDEIIEEAMDKLKKKSENDFGQTQNYKLDMIASLNCEKKTSLSSYCNTNHQQMELKENIQRILSQAERSSPNSSDTKEKVEDSRIGSSLCFSVHQVSDGNNNAENFLPLFSFLERQDYREEFGLLYGPALYSIFTGYSDEDELVTFLGVARETARKRCLFWTQTRLCFLLGKLCAGKSKFSQARVYFEEALGVPREGFTDFRLLAGIFSHLAAVYLVQKNKESFFAVAERLAALLMGILDCVKSLGDTSVLKYILKKAVLCQQKQVEARACYLLARHHWNCDEADLVVPYLERLLAIGCEAQKTWSVAPSSGYLTLGQLYSKLQLYHLSVGSAKRASLQPSLTLPHCLGSMMLVLDSMDGQGKETSLLPQVAPYFQKVLSVTMDQGGESVLQHVLSHQLTLSLCQLLYKHRRVDQAINHMLSLINNSPSSDQVPVPPSEMNGALIWFAWLHINNNQPDTALDILDSILASMSGHCRSPQEGMVLNMRGVALRCVGDHRGAAESYQAAAEICKENEDMPNWAVARANLGLLCLKAGAKGLALRYLTEAVQLFSEISNEGCDENFITVMLELGQLYVMQQQLDYGRGCYEWALLLAIRASLLESQLKACRHLCHLYGHESPDQAQCIIYNQHQVQLFRSTGDKRKEGDMLEVISQLYLSLNTDRVYRTALDYTKSSLAIFIDLGCKEKEAYGWLKAGRIYQLLGQTELVDIHVQAAQEVSLSTGDTSFILKLLEDAGDIFFNSCQDRDKAITFYRDRALPIAVKSSSARTRLRLCNKLTELMFFLKLYTEAVEFAKTAADISISLGERLNERVSYHRLASLYRCLQQPELAEHYYLKALSLCPTPLQFDEETLYYVKVYQTLGDIIFCDLKDPFDAAGYYHLALAAAMDLGDKRSQLQLCTRLATIYHNFIVDRELSLFFYQKARGFAAELNVRRINISSDQQSGSISQHQTSGP